MPISYESLAMPPRWHGVLLTITVQLHVVGVTGANILLWG
jgi:hypothetical protein